MIRWVRNIDAYIDAAMSREGKRPCEPLRRDEIGRHDDVRGIIGSLPERFSIRQIVHIMDAAKRGTKFPWHFEENSRRQPDATL